ncbi:MAG: hypothetical protein ACXWCU_12225 [Caldimonas sp.]
MSGAGASLGPQWFLLAFAALWLGVTALLSRAGGWSRLAASFRARHPASGDRFRFVSGSLGAGRFPVRYNNCLFVVVSRRGMHLSILFPFRFGSPPLFIPWSEVESVIEKPFFRTFGVAVRLRGSWPTIAIRGRAAQSIRAAWGGASGPRTR